MVAGGPMMVRSALSLLVAFAMTGLLACGAEESATPTAEEATRGGVSAAPAGEAERAATPDIPEEEAVLEEDEPRTE
jgi:hypothetical protein